MFHHFERFLAEYERRVERYLDCGNPRCGFARIRCPDCAEERLVPQEAAQVTVRYYGLYANAHRGKVRKARLEAFPLRLVEEEPRRVPSKGWAAMIRKVYEVDPLRCPKCGGNMKVIAFLTEPAVVDRIIEHLKLAFVADRPPPHQALLTPSGSPVPAHKPSLTHPELILILHHDGWMGLPNRQRGRKAARSKRNFLSIPVPEAGLRTPRRISRSRDYPSGRPGTWWP